MKTVSDDLYGLTVLHVFPLTRVYGEAGSSGKRENRNSWGIIVRYEGWTDYVCEGVTIRSDRAHMALLPKGVSYRWRCGEAGHYYALNFDAAVEGDPEKKAEASCRIRTFTVREPEKILKVLRNLELLVDQKDPAADLESKRAVYEILHHYLYSEKKAYVSSDMKSRVRPAVEYLQTHYREDIRNDTLAALTGFSTAYFRRIFTEVTGVSPIQYLKMLRIEKAKVMLHGDFGTVTEIALQLGYADLYEFSRSFKNVTGVSPTAYLKKHCLI